MWLVLVLLLCVSPAQEQAPAQSSRVDEVQSRPVAGSIQPAGETCERPPVPGQGCGNDPTSPSAPVLEWTRPVEFSRLSRRAREQASFHCPPSSPLVCPSSLSAPCPASRVSERDGQGQTPSLRACIITMDCDLL